MYSKLFHLNSTAALLKKRSYETLMKLLFVLTVTCLSVGCEKNATSQPEPKHILSQITAWNYFIDYPSGQLKDTGYTTIDLTMDNNRVIKSHQEYIGKDGSLSGGIDSIRYLYLSEDKLSAIYSIENGQDNIMDSLSYNTMGAVSLVQHYTYPNRLYGYTQYNYNSNSVLYNISYYEKRGSSNFDSYGSDTLALNNVGDIETLHGYGMEVTVQYLDTANKLTTAYPYLQFIEYSILGGYSSIPPLYGASRNYLYQNKLVSKISVNDYYYKQTYTYDFTYEFDEDGYPLMVRVNGNPFKKYEYK